MSKLWEKFFAQEPFEFAVPDLGAKVQLEERNSKRKLGDALHPQDRGLMIGLRTHSRAWRITLTTKGKLAAKPDKFIHSDLLGASQLPLYNTQGDEQAIVCAVNGDVCLMLSDPAERFAENCQFPAFFEVDGKEQMARHQRALQVGRGWGLTLLRGSEPRPGVALVVLGGKRGCILLSMMSAKMPGAAGERVAVSEMAMPLTAMTIYCFFADSHLCRHGRISLGGSK